MAKAVPTEMNAPFSSRCTEARAGAGNPWDGRRSTSREEGGCLMSPRCQASAGVMKHLRSRMGDHGHWSYERRCSARFSATFSRQPAETPVVRLPGVSLARTKDPGPRHGSPRPQIDPRGAPAAPGGARGAPSPRGEQAACRADSQWGNRRSCIAAELDAPRSPRREFESTEDDSSPLRSGQSVRRHDHRRALPRRVGARRRGNGHRLLARHKVIDKRVAIKVLRAEHGARKRDHRALPPGSEGRVVDR